MERIPKPHHNKKVHVRADKVRVIMGIYRKQGMSFEDFSQYLVQEHSHIMAVCPIVKKNVLKFELILADQESGRSIKTGGSSIRMADFDALAIFDAASHDKVMEVFADGEYKAQVVADQKNFADVDRCFLFPSHIYDIFDDPS